ncbi:MAG TPA: PIG-L family deacetylase [Alphaproteobacteria bacterium]|nr:PIG-L family deacetylase [Alphaproteobacteria bacterium]
MFGKNILILVPHPDDEIVACSATIARAQREGAKIFALYLTHGCIAKDVMWPWDRKNYDSIVTRRRAEGESVAQFLGITPVGWFPRPARHLWQEMGKVRDEIEAAITANAIDQIWVPAYEGGNADHDALNAIGQIFKSRVSVLEFAEYNYFHRRTNSQNFPYADGNEIIFELTPDEQRKKRDALRMYKSEKQNLNYVDVRREAFRPLGNYDYSQPPHPGTLWYARFQWVPFKHPRVDFTNPADVSSAIMRFLPPT